MNKRSRRFKLKALTAALASCFVGGVIANPQAPTVVAGQATFQQIGKTLNITNTPGAIINWQSFNIQRDELTKFIQQSAQSQVLNRITGGDPSQILGALQSNGRVLIINPNGVIFGKDARVDVAGLLVSTLQIKDADFLAGKYKFNDTPGAGKIDNQGVIKTATGGQVILIAPQVENSGLISSPEGQILLAAGKSVTIADPDKPAIQVEITNREQTAVNLGTLLAKEVSIYGGLIKNTGLIQATTAQIGANGKISLRAKYDVENTGTIQANGAIGGDILIQAEQGVAKVQGLVEARALNSTQLALQEQITAQLIKVASEAVPLAVNAQKTAETSTQDYNLQLAAEPTAFGQISSNLSLNWLPSSAPATQITQPTGPLAPLNPNPTNPNNPLLPNRQQGQGGSIRVLGRSVRLEDGADLSTTGANAGGVILVGGDYQGKNTEIQNALTTYVASTAKLDAGALENGHGGKVIVWADDTALVYGQISARGGAISGDGGFVETSGKHYLDVTNPVDASAAHGKAGLWLLDPNNVTIQASGSDTGVMGNPDFTTTADSSIITVSTIETALNLGTSVSITTSAGGTQNGDVNVNSAITKSAGTDATLTLTAHNNININAGISANGSLLHLNLNANSDSVGGGQVNFASASTISLNGGTLTLGNGNMYLGNNAVVSGGTLAVTNGSTAKYIVDAGWSTPAVLDGITLSGNLQIVGNGHAATLRNGLTLNGGIVTIGDASVASNTLFWDGTQSILGNGRIQFNGYGYYWGDAQAHLTGSGAAGTTLTLGPGITLAAVNAQGQIDGANGNRYNLINQGTIDSSVSGQSLIVNVDSAVAGNGTFSVANGGRLEIAGTFTTPALGSLSNSGGWLGLTGTLLNANNTLTLNDTTGSFYLGNNAVVSGGTLAVTNGSTAKYIVDAGWSTPAVLDGITLSGNLQIVGNGHAATLRNGLTLNGGIVTIGDASVASNTLFWDGTQSILGNGRIQFNGYGYYWGDAQAHLTGSGAAGTTLTLGPGITLAAVNAQGQIDGANGNRYNLINQGTIDSSVSGQSLVVNVDSAVAGNGTLSVANGGRLEIAGTFTTPALGSLSNSGGWLGLTGTLLNANNTLTLNDTTGNFYLGNNAVVSGGTLAVANGSTAKYIVDVAGSVPAVLDGITLSGNLQVVGHGNSATLRNGLTLNGGIVTIGDASVARTYLNWDGTQSILGNGRIEFNGYDTNYAAHLTGTGAAGTTLTVGSGVTLAALHGQGQIDGTGSNRYNLINQGTIDSSVSGQSLVVNVDSAVAGNGSLSVANGGRLEIAGTFTTPALGSLSNSGGWLGLTGTLLNSGSTLTLNDTTGSFYLGDGAVVSGGTLAIAGGSTSKFIVNSRQNGWGTPAVLDAVTLSGGLQITNNLSAATIQNGLTLSGGVVTIGDGIGEQNWLNWDGTQSISGSGRIEFNSLYSGSPAYLTGIGATGTTLTVGPNITLAAVHGLGLLNGANGRYNLINQGTIDSSVAGQGLMLDVDSSVAGNGMLSVANGGRLDIRGTFTTAALGTLRNSGGWLGLTGTLLNTNNTLTLNNTTGDFYLGNGGVVTGGVLAVASGSTSKYLVAAYTGFGSPAVLDGVTLAGEMQLSPDWGGAALILRNGLTLNNGVITLGDGRQGNTFLRWDGTQSISGSGRIEFNNLYLGCGNGCSYLTGIGAAGTTLTVGPNVTLAAVHGQGMVDGVNGNRYNLINQGTIDSSVSGQILRLDVDSSVAGNGTLSVANGGRLEIGGTFTTAALGNLRNSGGWLGLTGTLLNSGSTLTLNDTTGDFYLGNGGVVTGGVLAVASGSASKYLVAAYTGFGSPAVLDGVTLAGKMQLSPDWGGAALILRNGLTLNNGVITLGDGGQGNTFLRWDGTQSISGSGRIEFNNLYLGCGNGCSYLTGIGAAGTTLTVGPNVTLAAVHGQGMVDGANGNRYSLINQGTIDSSVSGQILRLDVDSSVAGNGMLSVANGGRLEIAGTFTNASGGQVNLSNGTIYLGSNGSWSNAGRINVSGGTLYLAGNSTTAGFGTFTQTGGTVELTGSLANTGNTLNLSDIGLNNFNISGGTIVGGTITSTNAATFTATAGTLNGVTLATDLTVNSGSLHLLNGLTLSGGKTLKLDSPSGSSWLYYDNTQAIGGTGNILFGNSGVAVYVAGSSADLTLTLGSGISVTTSGVGSAVLGYYATDNIINQGAISNTSGKILGMYGLFTNAAGAQLNVSSGRVDLSNPSSNYGTINIGSGAAMNTYGSNLTNASGATIKGSGTLNLGTGSLINNGILAPGSDTQVGTLSITGNVVFGSTGELKLKFAGDSSSQVDKLAVSGNVTLGGTLRASYLNGYQAGYNDSFNILTTSGLAGSLSGSFASVVLPSALATHSLNTTGGTGPLVLTMTDGVLNTWTGAVSNYWDDVGNWSQGHAPLTSELAIIPATASPYVEVRTSATTRLIYSDELLKLTGASGALAVNGKTTLNSGLDLAENTSLNSTGVMRVSAYTLGSGARIDLGASSFVLNGQTYNVINSLGSAGSTTTTDLQGITGGLSGKYVLGANIDASASASWNSGAGFAPIETFTGTLDGLGHAISGLTINRPTTANVGLFSVLGSGARVQNFGLSGGATTGLYYVGALAGQNVAGTVENVFATGNVTAQGSFYAWGLNQSSVGGLVGQNSATILNSYALGAVTGQGMVGGLVGTNLGSITGSHADGNVTGGTSTADSGIGGLVGYNHYSGCNPCSISNSYATGNVNGHNNIGGLVGWSGGSVSNSFATGSVTTYVGGWQTGGLIGYNRFGGVTDSFATGDVVGGTNAGGLIGWNSGPVLSSYSLGHVTAASNAQGLIGYSDGSVTASYWDTQSSGQASSTGGGIGLTTAQMLSQSNFSGWDFSAVWQSDGIAQPTLRGMPSPFVTNTWTGLADHLSWNNAGNWSLGHVPTSMESVVITNLSNTDWISISGIYSLRNIVSAELIKLTGNGTTATILSSGTLSAGLELASNTLLTSNGALSISGFAVDLSGKIVSNSSLSISLTGNLTNTNGGGTQIDAAAGTTVSITAANIGAAGLNRIGIVPGSAAVNLASSGNIYLEQVSGDLALSKYAITSSGVGKTVDLLAGAGNVYLDTALDASLLDDNVSLRAKGATSDVIVSASTSKSTAGDGSLTLKADRDVTVNSGVGLLSTNGKLAVSLISNTDDGDATNGGAILMGSSSSILSNGGNIVLTGGSAGSATSGYAQGRSNAGDFSSGILLEQVQLLSGGGNVVLRGRGATTASLENRYGFNQANGVYIAGSSASTINSGDGKISVFGVTAASGNLISAHAVNFGTQNLGFANLTSNSSAADAIVISGDASASNLASGWVNGLQLQGGLIQATHSTGGIVLTGLAGSTAEAGDAGLAIANGVTLSAAGGLISITANKGEMLGTISNPTGRLSLNNSGVAAISSGALSVAQLELLGSTASYNLTNSANAVGIVAAATGSLNLTNSSALTVGSIGSTSGILTTGPLNLTISAADQTLTVANAINTHGAALTLVADKLNLSADVNSGAGLLTIRPNDNAQIIQMGTGATDSTTSLGLDAAELLHLYSSGGLTIGSSSLAGGINVLDSASFANVTAGTLSLTAASPIVFDGKLTAVADEVNVTSSLPNLDAIVFRGLTGAIDATGKTVRLNASNSSLISTLAGVTRVKADSLISNTAFSLSGSVLTGYPLTYFGSTTQSVVPLETEINALQFTAGNGVSVSNSATSGTFTVSGAASTIAGLHADISIVERTGNLIVGSSGVLSSSLARNVSLSTLAAGKNLTLGGAVNSNGGVLQLSALGNVTQSAGANILTSGLELLGSGATYALSNTGNSFGTLAADTGAMTLRTNGALTLGGVGSTSGIRGTGLNLTTNGTIYLGAGRSVSLGGGAFDFSGGYLDVISGSSIANATLSSASGHAVRVFRDNDLTLDGVTLGVNLFTDNYTTVNVDHGLTLSNATIGMDFLGTGCCGGPAWLNFRGAGTQTLAGTGTIRSTDPSTHGSATIQATTAGATLEIASGITISSQSRKTYLGSATTALINRGIVESTGSSLNLAGTSITNTGTIRTNGGQVVLNGPTNSSGTILLQGATGGTLTECDLPNPCNTVYRNYLTLNAPLDVTGTFTMSGGMLSGNSTLNVNGAFNYTAGSFANTLTGLSINNVAGGLSLGNIGINGAVSLIAGNGGLNLGSISGTTLFGQASAGNITLNSGTSLTSTATSGNGIVLDAGAGGFINNSGSNSPLSVAGSARWLIYAANPGSVTKNGMTSDFRHYGVDRTTYASPIESGNGFIYTSMAGTLTAATTLNSGSASHVYGDNVTAGLGVTLSGFADSEDNASNIGLNGNIAWSNLPGSTSGVGTYNVTYGSGLSSTAGYTFTAGSGLSYSVTPRPITVTANVLNKTYGDADPALSYTIGGSGLVNNDSLSGSLSRALGETVAGGPYAISQNDLAASANYSLTYTGSALTISPRPITVTGDALIRTYGDANPLLTYHVAANGVGSSRGLVGNDTLVGSLDTLATQTSNVGAYATTQGTLANSNYAITYQPGSLQVNPAMLTISAVSDTRMFAEDGSLRGTTSSAVTPTVSGLKGSDTVTGLVQSFDSPYVGNRTLTVASIFTVNDGNQGNNYTLTRLTAPGTITADPSNFRWVANQAGAWETGTNWNQGVMPVLHSQVTVPTLSGSLTFSSGTSSIQSLNSGASLNVLGGTFNVGDTAADASTFAAGKSVQVSGGTFGLIGGLAVDTFVIATGATVNLNNASIFVVNPLNNDGRLNVQSGTFAMNTGGSHHGAFNVVSGATLDFVAGVNDFGDGSSLNGPGAISRSSGASFILSGLDTGTTLGADAVLNLNDLAFTGAGKLSNAGTLSGNALTLNNFFINAETGTTNFTNMTLGSGFINYGTMNLLGNLHALGASATQAGGSINLNSAATLTKDTGTLYWSGGEFGGNGTLAFANGGNFAFAGSGNRVINNPNMTFDFTGGLSLPNGSLTVRRGNLYLGGLSSIPNGVILNLDGGVLRNTGQLDIYGTFNLTGGLFEGSGGLAMKVGGALNRPLDSQVDWQSSGPLANSGTMNLGGGEITNAIQNQGTIILGAATTFRETFTNTGTLEVGTGTTVFQHGYEQTSGQLKLGVVDVNGNRLPGNVQGDVNINGGTLAGGGTINGNVVVGTGNFNPGFSPGSMTITGNLTLSPTGNLTIELGGTVQGSQYDFINVLGTAALAGALNVTGYNGYVPSAGNTFNFLNANAITGSFATVNLPVAWNLSYLANSSYLQLLANGIVPSNSSLDTIIQSMGSLMTRETVIALGDSVDLTFTPTSLTQPEVPDIDQLGQCN